MRVWACRRQMIRNKFIENFNTLCGGKQPFWRIICKDEDKVNMVLKGMFLHSKG
jgi:hypothetical protein